MHCKWVRISGRDYWVSDQGHVQRARGWRDIGRRKRLKPFCAGGRACVRLGGRTEVVARLVLESFGVVGEGMPVHRDGDRTNCALSNLEWGTGSRDWFYPAERVKGKIRLGFVTLIKRDLDRGVDVVRRWRISPAEAQRIGTGDYNQEETRRRGYLVVRMTQSFKG